MTKTGFFIGGTSGLGEALAEQAIEAGYEVTIAGRTGVNCHLANQRRARGMWLDLLFPHSSEVFVNEPSIGPFDLIVWCAGVRWQGSLLDMQGRDIEDLTNLHVTGPTIILAQLLRRQRTAQRSCQLVIVASTTAFKIRSDEAVYGGHNAYKAQLARNLGLELPKTIEGSTVLLVNPGGMNTPFWRGESSKAEHFMDPKKVAREIWVGLGQQSHPFEEMNLFRTAEGEPRVSYRTETPGV